MVNAGRRHRPFEVIFCSVQTRQHRLEPEAELRELFKRVVIVEKTVLGGDIVLTRCRRSEYLYVHIALTPERLFIERRHKIYRPCLRRLIEPASVYLYHKV